MPKNNIVMTGYKPKFFKPTKVPIVFDDKGDEVDISSRGLDYRCPIVENKRDDGKHYWLLLPKTEGQKQYLYCLKCSEYSHL